MKIFIDINNKKIESENKSEPNYYLLKFKDIEVKDEFQEFSFKIVNNIEVKLNMKVKNKFNSVKVGNLFQKFQQVQNKKEEIFQPKSIIGTGINMKERLAMFSNAKKDNSNIKISSTKNVPKKLKLPANLMGNDSKSKFTNETKKELKEIKKENKDIKKEIEENKEKEKNNNDKINKEKDNKESKIESIEKKESKENKEII